MAHHDGDMDVDADHGMDMLSLPPGEEAMFLSHEGGEEELCRDMFAGETLSV